jgi:hypothetical protein
MAADRPDPRSAAWPSPDDRLGVVLVGIAVVLGVELAGFTGVMLRIGRMAGGDMGVVTGGFGVAGFMMRGGFAVMLGGVFVVVRGLGVVLVGVVGRRHRATFRIADESGGLARPPF